MIGIDIVSIKRIEANLKKYDRIFLSKFLSNDEIVLTQTSRGYKSPSIAGFWAAKEACSKAIGVGIGNELRFHDIKLSKTQKNAPLIHLSLDKMQAFNIKTINLSISHDDGFAIAVVIIETTN